MIGCCGQPAPRRRPPPRVPLAPNPRVPNGVRLLYLGEGRADLLGRATRLTYHVSDQRRDFTAHPDDVAGLLRPRRVIQL